MTNERVLISIDCVDGETNYTCSGPAKMALDFLTKLDHEGSSLRLYIDGSAYLDPDIIYNILKRY